MPARISTAATAASSAHHHGPPRKYSNEDAPAYPWQKLVSHERQAQMRKLNEWKRRNSELMRYSKPCKVAYGKVNDTNLRRILASSFNSVDDIHQGFRQGDDFTSPMIEAVPMEKSIKADTCLLITNKEQIISLVSLTKDRICVARGADPRTMTDHIPLEEVDRVELGDDEIIKIFSSLEGVNSGRTYTFQMLDSDLSILWKKDIEALKLSKLVKNAKWVPKMQRTMARVYDSPQCQAFVALLIMVNFLIVCADAQMRPEVPGSEYRHLENTINILDFFFTIIFIFELAINMFAHWFNDFITSPWNLFDTFVVLVSAISLDPTSVVPGVTILRSMRALRVLRLAGKLKSLKRIITALMESILPVMNAFLIAIIVTSIFAVLGVEFFKDRSTDSFKTFSRAFYTLFKVMSFQEWVGDEIPVLKPPDFRIDFVVLFYLVSLVISVLWILLQVVVAVLLDNFVQATQREERLDAVTRLHKAEAESFSEGGIDPLLKKMSSLFDTSTQLRLGIARLFFCLDDDETGYLNFNELKNGLRKLNIEPTINLQWEDFNIITRKGLMLNARGELSLAKFDELLRHQLKIFIQRHLTDVMSISMKTNNIENLVMISAIRFMILQNKEEDEMERTNSRMRTLSKRLDALMGAIQHAPPPPTAPTTSQKTLQAPPSPASPSASAEHSDKAIVGGGAAAAAGSSGGQNAGASSVKRGALKQPTSPGATTRAKDKALATPTQMNGKHRRLSIVDGSVNAKDGHSPPPSQVQGQPRAQGAIRGTQPGYQEGDGGGGGGGEGDGGVGEGGGVDGRVGGFENGRVRGVSSGGIAQVDNRHQSPVNGFKGNGWSPQMTAGGGGGGGGGGGANASQIVSPGTVGGDFGQAYYGAFGLDGADAAVGECA